VREGKSYSVSIGEISNLLSIVIAAFLAKSKGRRYFFSD
jgi:hypothetical protein